MKKVFIVFLACALLSVSAAANPTPPKKSRYAAIAASVLRAGVVLAGLVGVPTPSFGVDLGDFMPAQLSDLGSQAMHKIIAEGSGMAAVARDVPGCSGDCSSVVKAVLGGKVDAGDAVIAMATSDTAQDMFKDVCEALGKAGRVPKTEKARIAAKVIVTDGSTAALKGLLGMYGVSSEAADLIVSVSDTVGSAAMDAANKDDKKGFEKQAENHGVVKAAKRQQKDAAASSEDKKNDTKLELLEEALDFASIVAG